jgi:hypothetical protein
VTKNGNNKLKRLVRARMTNTGESYTDARRAILAEDDTSCPRCQSSNLGTVVRDGLSALVCRDCSWAES